MISLKRNSAYELIPAKGKRLKANTIYKPGQKEDFQLSRGKFVDFLSCPKCFYLDRVKGLISPSLPGWTLNETTDILLKKEFDKCRKEQLPHRIHLTNNLEHIIPFSHIDIDKWRDSLHHGIKCRFKNTNIILSGGVDDIWKDTRSNEIIVVDYKSQASNYNVSQKNYLNSPFRENYRKQIDFYAFILSEMGHNVSDKSYFYVCNADRTLDAFNGQLKFSETLIEYMWDSSWIPKEVENMIKVINSNSIPEPNLSCENCAYNRERSKFEKQDMSSQLTMFD